MAANSSPFHPSFPVPQGGQGPPKEPPAVQAIIDTLKLQLHVEGGYFVETDRDPLLIPSPFPATAATTAAADPSTQRPGFDPAFRNASTSIFYFITPGSPQGHFHRNRGRTVHTLHRGRGRYVLIDENNKIETFIVGHNIAAGEKLQWIVEGNKFKASFLLPDIDRDGNETDISGGLLISETVVPGFEYYDHDFLVKGSLAQLIGQEKAAELAWLVRD